MRRDENLDVVRCIMNYMIVVMHAWAAFQYVDTTAFEFKAWTFICEYVCHSAMPTFFLISGYLLFQNFTGDTIVGKLKRRMRRLVVPYVIWNTTFVLFYLAVCKFVPRLSARVATFGLDTWSGALSKIVSFTVLPIDGPLWFLRALIYLTIASPLIGLVLKLYNGIPLLALSLVWIFVEDVLGWGSFLGLVLPGFAIACFVFGAVVAVNGKDLVALLKHKWLIWVGVVAIAIRGYLYAPSFLDPIHYPSWIGHICSYLLILEAPTLIAVAAVYKLGDSRFAQTSIYRYLKDMSFFAYAGHFLFCSIFLHSIAPKLGFMATGKMTACVLIFVGLGVPTMALVYGLAKKLCPKLLKLYDGTL